MSSGSAETFLARRDLPPTFRIAPGNANRVVVEVPPFNLTMNPDASTLSNLVATVSMNLGILRD
jgi:hypothetical protein